MAAAAARIVYNHDVAGLQARFNRFIIELTLCASNSSSQVNSYDQARLATYIGAIRTYMAWVIAQPQLDLPETHPYQYELEPDPDTPDIENESLRDIVRMLVLAREEMVNGQSARMASGLIKFDQNRMTAVIDKVEAFLKNYIALVTPLDLPESSPMDPMAPAGKTGV